MKIGLSQRVLYHKGRAYDSIEHSWYSYLKEHVLVPLPNRQDLDPGPIADELDMLIITGGDDSPIRRLTELRLARCMTLRNKPIIGICHGCFLLTESLGGVVSEIDSHMDTDHLVYYFGEELLVNSYHNLYIQQTHKKATTLVVDSQGNTEAWIDENVAGVVWHPERMANPWLPDEIQNLFT